jgi:hypothetical protein
MEDAARARGAARDAVEDITPAGLRDAIDDRLAAGSMIPGVLTLVSARVGDGSVDAYEVERRTAGVQLIYEGLRLTRTLAREEPWAALPATEVPADLDVVAADVLVSRGFSLLAHTPAADQAVRTVREFGRVETDRQAGRTPADDDLETNVFELAVIAGATAGSGDVPLPLRQYVVGLARSRSGPLGPAEEALPETLEEVMRRVSVDAGEESARPAGSLNRND